MHAGVQHALTALGSAAAIALAQQVGLVQPAKQEAAAAEAENAEYAANAGFIRDQLAECLEELKACYRECE